jgi:tRNA-dihydrouridine synthase B
MGLTIGTLKLASPLVLAPMTRITDHPFRKICSAMGAGLVTTEMVSAEGLVRGSEATRGLLPREPCMSPVAVQLFGASPGVLAEAARICQEEGAHLVDLNMGCPVPKVVRRGAGAALLRDLPGAARILSAMRRSLSVPLTVKIRSGWTAQENVVMEMGRIATQTGVDAITLHPRARSDGYGQPARWELVRALVENFPIPVIGSGDVRTPEDAIRMLGSTGCQGVMIGRAAIGNPWIFGQTLQLLAGREPRARPDPEEIWRVLGLHLEAILSHYGPKRALAPARLHASRYIRGLDGSAGLRASLSSCPDLAGLREALKVFLVG